MISVSIIFTLRVFVMSTRYELWAELLHDNVNSIEKPNQNKHIGCSAILFQHCLVIFCPFVNMSKVGASITGRAPDLILKPKTLFVCDSLYGLLLLCHPNLGSPCLSNTTHLLQYTCKTINLRTLTSDTFITIRNNKVMQALKWCLLF